MKKHDYYFLYPKNFEGIFDIIQKNAIRSWRHLSNDIEIIIFGDSKGAKEISDEVEGIYYPDVKCSKTECLYFQIYF